MSKLAPSEISMSGQRCLVTGANSGLGLITAQSLCARGAEVALLCRSEARGREAVEHIERATGGRPELFLADLSDLAHIDRVASELTERYDRLDVLVNNAGAYFPKYLESAQGHEMTFALNHLGYFALTQRLLPLVKAALSGRIVNVASRAHRMSALDFDDLHFRRRKYRPFVVYGTSKLLNILFTRTLAKRLKAEGSSVTANCLHPGVVRTGFGHDYKSLFSTLARLVSPFLMSPEEGAKTSIYLASSPEVSGVSGSYFAKSQEVRPKRQALDDEAAERLWTLSASLVADFTERRTSEASITTESTS
jgi:retinol dehydrogenase 12